MVLAYAPLLRYDIAANNGFVALEESKGARRQTPFAKCDIRWYEPVVAGDIITGTRRVVDKYERRGSKFVTFRVEAFNQRDVKVAAYDYTCIFEYAGGRKAGPPPTSESGESGATAVAPGQPVAEAPRLLTFDAVSVEDALPTLRVTESPATINRFNDLRLAGKPSASNIHTDEAFARQNIFGGAVNAGPATMAYVDQMLELSFPLRAFYYGGRLVMRAIEPFRAGHVVTLQGEVTAAQVQGTQCQVVCSVRGTNQDGALVCLCDATLNLPARHA
jgi:acyl dehydratase